MENIDMRNIIVIGACGFIGKKILSLIHNKFLNWRVYAIDKNTSNQLEQYDCNRLIYMKASSDNILSTLDNIEVDIIIHLGEFSRINASFANISEVLQSNVIGTIKVLEFAKMKNALLVYSASSSVYDINLTDNINPYTLSKKHNIEWIKRFNSWFGLRYCILYFYNVYGDGQTSDDKMGTVIGKFMNSYQKRELLQVVSPGTQKRAFTHIDDTMDAIELIFNKNISSVIENGLPIAEEYNITSEKEYSIIDVAKMFNIKNKNTNNNNNNTFDTPNYIIVKGDRVNRMSSDGNADKLHKLGWKCNHSLMDYIYNNVN